MAHYLFNTVAEDATQSSSIREGVTGALEAKMWGVDADERHRDALAPGDLALIYLGAPVRVIIGRVELASAVHEWTPPEAARYPGNSPSGVLLAEVEHWDPPVPMADVLSRIGPTDAAKADFQAGVVRIVEREYEAAIGAEAAR